MVERGHVTLFFRVDCFFLKMPIDAKDLAADLKGVISSFYLARSLFFLFYFFIPITSNQNQYRHNGQHERQYKHERVCAVDI